MSRIEEPIVAECLSSLDHSETNQHPLAVQSRAQHALHARSWMARKRVIEALWNAKSGRLNRRAQKMGMCGVSPQIAWCEGEVPRPQIGWCRDRMCPSCTMQRAFRVRKKVADWLNRMDVVRFVTLTIRSTGGGLRPQIDALMDAFRKMRRRREWKRHVKGGLYVLEVTHSPEHGWHPHLHLLVTGTYWDQRKIQEEWSEVVGDLGIVDIRAVRERSSAVKYVSKYVSKQSSPCGDDPRLIEEFAEAMQGVRLVDSFGQVRAESLKKAEQEPEPEEKKPLKRLTYLMLVQEIEAGSVMMREVATLLAASRWQWAELFKPHGIEVERRRDSLTLADVADFAWLCDAAHALITGIQPDATRPDPLPPRWVQEYFDDWCVDRWV